MSKEGLDQQAIEGSDHALDKINYTHKALIVQRMAQANDLEVENTMNESLKLQLEACYLVKAVEIKKAENPSKNMDAATMQNTTIWNMSDNLTVAREDAFNDFETSRKANEIYMQSNNFNIENYKNFNNTCIRLKRTLETIKKHVKTTLGEDILQEINQDIDQKVQNAIENNEIKALYKIEQQEKINQIKSDLKKAPSILQEQCKQMKGKVSKQNITEYRTHTQLYIKNATKLMKSIDKLPISKQEAALTNVQGMLDAFKKRQALKGHDHNKHITEALREIPEQKPKSRVVAFCVTVKQSMSNGGQQAWEAVKTQIESIKNKAMSKNKGRSQGTQKSNDIGR